MEECLMKKEEIQRIIKKVFKEEYKVLGMTRLLGGAQKRVYKIECSHHFSCVLYI